MLLKYMYTLDSAHAHTHIYRYAYTRAYTHTHTHTALNSVIVCTSRYYPLLYTQDPVYPIIFYECIHHCWKQDYIKRPSAEEVSTQLQNSQSSPINKHTIVTFSSISTIAVVYANGVQCLWAVTECPVRRLDDPSVRSRVELAVIQQSHPSRLEFMVSTSHNMLHARQSNMLYFYKYLCYIF